MTLPSPKIDIRKSPTEAAGISLDSIRREIPVVSQGNFGVRETIKLLLDGEMTLDPEYQRGHVWSEDQQKDYMGFLLEGGTAPSVYIRELPSPASFGVPYLEVVDGKQRITALYMWWTGHIPARLSSGDLVWAKDMDIVERRNLDRALALRVNFVRGADKDIMWIYLRLNTGGVVHSPEEIARVRSMMEASS